MAIEGRRPVFGRPRFRRIGGTATATDFVERRFGRDDRDRLWVTDITEHPHAGDPRSTHEQRHRAVADNDAMPQTSSAFTRLPPYVPRLSACTRAMTSVKAASRITRADGGR